MMMTRAQQWQRAKDEREEREGRAREAARYFTFCFFFFFFFHPPPPSPPPCQVMDAQFCIIFDTRRVQSVSRSVEEEWNRRQQLVWPSRIYMKCFFCIKEKKRKRRPGFIRNISLDAWHYARISCSRSSGPQTSGKRSVLASPRSGKGHGAPKKRPRSKRWYDFRSPSHKTIIWSRSRPDVNFTFSQFFKWENIYIWSHIYRFLAPLGSKLDAFLFSSWIPPWLGVGFSAHWSLKDWNSRHHVRFKSLLCAPPWTSYSQDAMNTNI